MRFDAIEMNGPLLGKQGANIASASTVDLTTATGNSLTVTGTTTITSFGTVQSGAVFALTFAGALTLTYNGTSLILPTSANITTAAGDVMVIESLGSGNWKCISYTRANGKSLFPFIESVTGLTVDNTTPTTPIIKPVYSFFNGVPGASENVAAGYVVGKSRIIDENNGDTYLYSSGNVTAVWDLILVNRLTFFASNGAGGGNTGSPVAAIGPSAARDNTGTEVSAIGNNAAAANTGSAVSAIGNSAAADNTGDNVSAIGSSAAYANTGSYVSAIGSNAANANTGSDVSAIGSSAAAANTGENVIALGSNAANANTVDNVIVLGSSAGASNTLPNSFIVSNLQLPSFVDYAAAAAVITGGSSNSTYLFFDQSDSTIKGIRFP